MNAFFFPRLHKVEALAPCNLRTWSTGEVLDVDVESALLSNPALCDILAPSVFALVHIGFGGCTIEWKDSEFGADNVYAWGKEQKGEASHQMFCDWMQRNTMHRVETLVPIENETVHEQIMGQIMQGNIKDEALSWILHPDMTYTRVSESPQAFSCHQFFMTHPSLSGRGSAKLRGMLRMEAFDWESLGHIDLLPAGHQLEKPELLFEKIEDEVIQAQVQRLLDIKKANEEASYKAEPIRENIAFEDFEKLDIRVGTVLSCERVPKMKKLLKFEIADGLENRTIVSGIAQHYEPEQLVGKQVCFIANLPPRAFKNGLVSEGMILSALNHDGSLSVVTVDREVKPGSPVA